MKKIRMTQEEFERLDWEIYNTKSGIARREAGLCNASDLDELRASLKWKLTARKNAIIVPDADPDGDEAEVHVQPRRGSAADRYGC